MGPWLTAELPAIFSKISMRWRCGRLEPAIFSDLLDKQTSRKRKSPMPKCATTFKTTAALPGTTQ
jgi:hypothetical protein